MRHRALSVIAAVSVLGIALVLGGAAPSQAGPPGKWTVISGGGVTNIDEPGMYRTADGALHVAMMRGSTTDSIDIAHISATGKLQGRQAVIDGWSSLTEDPDLVAAPGGGIRMVFGGIRTTTNGEPYTQGYLYQAGSDPSGTAWTLAPDTQPALAHTSGYASYGTGATSLADGTLVTAYPLNSTIYFQVGAGAVQSFDVPECCAYDMAVASDGVNAWASWYGNGGSGGNEGTLVRQIHPTLGPIQQAPQSVSGGDSLGTSQAVAMVSTSNGVFLAYLKGYPTAKAVVLWKLGTSIVKTVPGSEGASHVAMGAGPGGRLWLAWDTPSDDIRAVRTSTSGLKFGAVRDVSTPGSSTVYGVNIEGSSGTADIVFNDATRIWHTQVIPGLTLKASPSKWNGDKAVEVKFKVTDAGQAIAGAKVKALGETCTTAANGVCKIDFPKLGKGSYQVKATLEDYAPAKDKLKVT
jgi:hypothetical protein